jgi:gas vesicle protein
VIEGVADELPADLVRASRGVWSNLSAALEGRGSWHYAHAPIGVGRGEVGVSVMRLRLFVSGTLAAVVVLSASGALAAPLSEQKWRKQGNAICKQTNKELNEIGNEVFADLGPDERPSDEQATAFVEQFVPAIEGAVSSIDALNEPKSVKKDLKKLKTAVAQALDTLEADPTSIVNEDLFLKVDKIAKKLGLKECN